MEDNPYQAPDAASQPVDLQKKKLFIGFLWAIAWTIIGLLIVLAILVILAIVGSRFIPRMPLH